MEDDLRSAHTHRHTHTYTHKGVVPMATGASCPRRPRVEEVRPREEEAEVVRESSGYKQRSGCTRTHRFLFSILQEVKIVCVCM